MQDFRDCLRKICLSLRDEIDKRLKGAADVIKRLQQRLEIISGFTGQQRHAAAAETVIQKMHRARRRDCLDGEAGEVVAQFERRFHRRRRFRFAGGELAVPVARMRPWLSCALTVNRLGRPCRAAIA